MQRPRLHRPVVVAVGKGLTEDLLLLKCVSKDPKTDCFRQVRPLLPPVIMGTCILGAAHTYQFLRQHHVSCTFVYGFGVGNRYMHCYSMPQYTSKPVRMSDQEVGVLPTPGYGTSNVYRPSYSANSSPSVAAS